MIITSQKKGRELLQMLDGKKRIFIIGCGDCATTCKTGGEKEVQEVAGFLRENGKEISGFSVPEVACASSQAKIALAKNREALKKTDAVVVLACGSGVQCVQESDRMGLSVYPGCESLFSAIIDKDGAFREVCSSCGECILDLTGGICPVTRCSKSLLNGPCGGSYQGKCETDRQRDCAWVLIYQRLKEKGHLESLKRRLKPRSHQAHSRPGHVPAK